MDFKKSCYKKSCKIYAKDNISIKPIYIVLCCLLSFAVRASKTQFSSYRKRIGVKVTRIVGRKRSTDQ